MAIAVPVHAGISVALVPPYVEKTVRPGSTLSDVLSYTNQGTEPVMLQVDFADFEVDESGQVFEQAPGNASDSLIRHLRMSPTSIRVLPDQRVYLRYSIETPEEFDQMRGMVFVSSIPEVEPGGNKVRVVARLGIPIYVESRQAGPARLDVESVEWDRSPDTPGSLRLRLVVSNEGQRNIRPQGYVHVRSRDGKFNQTFDFNQGREPVLPGQKRRWDQKFGPVPEGALDVKLRMASSARASFEAEGQVAAVDESAPGR